MLAFKGVVYGFVIVAQGHCISGVRLIPSSPEGQLSVPAAQEQLRRRGAESEAPKSVPSQAQLMSAGGALEVGTAVM